MQPPAVPVYQPPPPDPQAVALQQQSTNDQTAAIQQNIQLDTSSLMARYGTRLALAGAAGAGGTAAMPSSPLAMPAAGR